MARGGGGAESGARDDFIETRDCAKNSFVLVLRDAVDGDLFASKRGTSEMFERREWSHLSTRRSQGDEDEGSIT